MHLAVHHELINVRAHLNSLEFDMFQQEHVFTGTTVSCVCRISAVSPCISIFGRYVFAQVLDFVTIRE